MDYKQLGCPASEAGAAPGGRGSGRAGLGSRPSAAGPAAAAREGEAPTEPSRAWLGGSLALPEAGRRAGAGEVGDVLQMRACPTSEPGSGRETAARQCTTKARL